MSWVDHHLSDPWIQPFRLVQIQSNAKLSTLFKSAAYCEQLKSLLITLNTVTVGELLHKERPRILDVQPLLCGKTLVR